MGAIEPSKAFTGAVIDNWYALNLSSNLTTGLGKWSTEDIANFLGCYLSEPKAHIFFATPDDELSLKKFKKLDHIIRNSFCLHGFKKMRVTAINIAFGEPYRLPPIE
jgi:hypothetical protein